MSNTLLTIQHNIFSCISHAFYIQDFFRELNRKGFITLLVILICIVALVTYFTALYGTFKTGFALYRTSLEIKELAAKIVILELELQKRQTEVSHMQIPELEGMEKISSIRYINPENATAFLSDTRNR